MSFASFGFINLSQVNPPPITGPQVQTTLTNKPAGSYFSERQYLEALKYRKPPPPPPRKLSAKELADLKFNKAESAAKLLPTSLYGRNDSINADQVRDNLKQARKDRDHEYYMEIVNREWAKFNGQKK